MNEAIELHDALLESVTTVASAMVLALHVGIHKSGGRPGVDTGTHYCQDVTIEIVGANLVGELGELPAGILHGDITVAGALSPNRIQLPCVGAGPFEITLYLETDYRQVRITGVRASVTRTSEPEPETQWLP